MLANLLPYPGSYRIVPLIPREYSAFNRAVFLEEWVWQFPTDRVSRAIFFTC